MKLLHFKKSVRIVWTYLFLTPIISFHICLSLIAQPETVEPEESWYETNQRVSEMADYFLQKVFAAENGFYKYRDQDYSAENVRSDHLILNSSDVILFGKEVEYRKLFFTGLYYDPAGQLNELRYFYFGDFSQLRVEYFLQREKIKSKYGEPMDTRKIGNRIETIWHYRNNKLVYTLGQEKVSSEGSVFFTMTRLAKDQVIEYAAKTPAPVIVPPDGPGKISASLDSPPPIESKIKVLDTPQLFTVSRSTSLRMEGIDGAPVITRIRDSETFSILDANSNSYWVKVKFEEKEGWVKKALIMSVQ